MFSHGKRISFFNSLLINIFLTPVIGIISVLKTERTVIIRRYKMIRTCDICENEYEGKEGKCPDCDSQNQNVFQEFDHFKLA